MVEPILVTRKGWRCFLEAIDFYEDAETDSPRVYLLHRALASKKRVKEGYMLYPLTQAERTIVLDVLDEWAQLKLEGW